MTVQQIFKLPEIKEIECEILTLETDITLRTCHEESKMEMIKELLRIRKKLLDDKFQINEEYARLLGEFNECLRQTLVKLKKQMGEAYDAVRGTIRSGRQMFPRLPIFKLSSDSNHTCQENVADTQRLH